MSSRSHVHVSGGAGADRHGAGGNVPDADQIPDDIAGQTLRAAIDQATESIVIADARGRIVYLNLAAERLIGRPRSELIDRHFVMALAAGHDSAQFDEISRAVGMGETWSGRQVATTSNGTTAAVDLVVSPVRDAAGRIANVVAIGRDVSRQQSLEGDLAREVRLHAGIVSTLSRLDASEDVEERAKRLVETLTDLDGVALARVVACGPADIWYSVAAQGYDEIAIAGPRPAKAFVRSIRRRARDGAWVESVDRWAVASRAGEPLYAAGISALAIAPISHRGVLAGLLVAATTDRDGTATLERHLSTIAELADVGSAMLGPSFAARARAADVPAVLERIIRTGAFRPVYQPIVRLRDGATLGYEALTRFDDGSPPDLRFAEAAAIGLSIELEVATLEAALVGAIALPGAGLLSVNVSPALIIERLRLDAVLRRSAHDRPIVLEITEREPVEDYRALRDAIAQIAIPVRWAIDDAGAGYASLRHILELRPQFVKLDRALIADIAVDPARQALVAGLLHFSAALGTTLVAEGIETNAERLALEQLGLTAGQGYVFGHPRSAHDTAGSVMPSADDDGIGPR